MLGAAQIVTVSGTACVEGLQDDGDGFTVTVSCFSDGFYDIVVRCASVDGGYKANYVDIDGERAGELSTQGRDWQNSRLEYVWLGAGTHEISVTKYWGWIRADSLWLEQSQSLPEDLYDVQPTLCDPNASDNAKRLMTYLCDSYGKYIISGQYCDEGMYGAENATIWRNCDGEYPAILGLDLIEYSPSRQAHGSTSNAVEKAIDYWEKGGIVTFCWHWNAPEKYLTGIWYSGFYKEYTDIDLAAIMEGRDQEGYELLLSDIDAIAAQLKRLDEAGVPVLWRPLHEASGGWFWWGSAGSEAYISLYRLLYDRLVNVHGLHNLIWVWNGQAADWYPGDEYVDIIGEDIYPGERVYTSQAARFIQATQYSRTRKLIVLSENGCLPDPDLAFRDGILWGYTGTWSGSFVVKNKAYNTLSEQYTDKDMLRKFYLDERVITRSELPDLKNYPLREEQ